MKLKKSLATIPAAIIATSLIGGAHQAHASEWHATAPEDMDIHVDNNHQYEVQWGDTLYNLSQATDTTVDEITSLNPQLQTHPQFLLSGSMLTLPSHAHVNANHQGVEQMGQNHQTTSANASESSQNKDDGFDAEKVTSSNDKSQHENDTSSDSNQKQTGHSSKDDDDTKDNDAKDNKKTDKEIDKAVKKGHGFKAKKVDD